MVYRMISTVKNILKPPKEGGLVSNSLVFRYDVTAAQDGLTGFEGTFNMCTFWYEIKDFFYFKKCILKFAPIG